MDLQDKQTEDIVAVQKMLKLTMQVLLAACAWSKIQGEVCVSP